MKYMLLTKTDQDSLLNELDDMPDLLATTFASLSPSEAATEGPDDLLSPVEQCWHLADLEREGFAVRIERLLSEDEPLLPDFDGARIAKERSYKTRSLAAGIDAFREARLANVRALRAIAGPTWVRRGTQEGVGTLALCDVPTMMAQHDAAHRHEIAAWARARGH